jgi:hypothetical protein
MQQVDGETATGSAVTNPYVFIVGCPRSGTTLLKRLVDAHPRIAITPETHWIPSFFRERTGLTPEGSATPALIAALLEYRTFPNLDIGRQELEQLFSPLTQPFPPDGGEGCVRGPSGEPVPYAQFVSGIFELYGRRQGKQLVGDKTPGYSRDVPLLHELWPRARFVHLIRDGRDVCLSAMNWTSKTAKLQTRFPTWRAHPVMTAALWWHWHVRLARQAGRALGQQLYYEIRYEALVARPVDECARLCAFLGVAYDDVMLRFHEGRTAEKPCRDAKHDWMPVTPGLRDWRSQLPSGDVESFEAVVGDVLDELGYERAVPRPTRETLQHAAAIREQFPKKSYFESLAALAD